MDTALLLIRLAVGLGAAAHGAQKLAGWWSGPGWQGTREMVARLRFQPPEFWRIAVIAGELGGGLLLALGFLSPLGSLGIIAVTAVAAITVHGSKGFFNQQGGWELAIVGYAIPALAILIAGPGRFSLDSALGSGFGEPAAGIVGLLLVICGIGYGLGTREVPPAEILGEAAPRTAPHPSEVPERERMPAGRPDDV